MVYSGQTQTAVAYAQVATNPSLQQAPVGHVQVAPAGHMQQAPVSQMQQAPADGHPQQAPVQMQQAPADGHPQQAPVQMQQAPADGHVSQSPAPYSPDGIAQYAPAGYAHAASPLPGQTLEDNDVRVMRELIESSDVTQLRQTQSVVLRGLSKLYGRLTAVDGISLTVAPGTCVSPRVCTCTCT